MRPRAFRRLVFELSAAGPRRWLPSHGWTPESVAFLLAKWCSWRELHPREVDVSVLRAVWFRVRERGWNDGMRRQTVSVPWRRLLVACSGLFTHGNQALRWWNI